jgi:hypothetical protein
MEVIGAHGLPEDAREPVLHYVSVPGADGVRVFAVGRTPHGTAYGRVDAAMRLDSGIDVVLRTRVFEMPQMAVIGAGVEQLMTTIAADGTTIAVGADGARTAVGADDAATAIAGEAIP